MPKTFLDNPRSSASLGVPMALPHLFCVVQIDLGTGRRQELPWRFPTSEEALDKIAELTMANPDITFIVKMVPAA